MTSLDCTTNGEQAAQVVAACFYAQGILGIASYNIFSREVRSFPAFCVMLEEVKEMKIHSDIKSPACMMTTWTHTLHEMI